jgi:mono/diheme cytochrome c family protein
MAAIVVVSVNITSAWPVFLDLHQPRPGDARVGDFAPTCSKEDGLLLFRMCLLLSALFAAPVAVAADADNGKRLAEARCVPCHQVGPTTRREVADAPPFETIARKFAPQPEMLAFSLLNPHPRMNVALTRREVEDIAAYINTLAR